MIKFFKKLFNKTNKIGFYRTEILILIFSDSTLFNVIQFHPKYYPKYKDIFELYDKEYSALYYKLSDKQINELKTYRYLKLKNIVLYYKNLHIIPI